MVQTRNSRQRNLILKLMENNYNHPTADELYELARAESPKISRGTVYRNLNLLAEQGEISRLAMPVGPERFDCKESSHYHFQCRKCGKVFDTPIEYDTSLNRTPPEMEGFKTERHRLILVGVCPDCAKKEKA